MDHGLWNEERPRRRNTTHKVQSLGKHHTGAQGATGHDDGDRYWCLCTTNDERDTNAQAGAQLCRFFVF